MLFFLIAIVLEVQKMYDRSSSLRHRALHCPQHLCAVRIPLDVSPCSKRALLFCSEERSTGVCRAPGSRGTGGWKQPQLGLRERNGSELQHHPKVHHPGGFIFISHPLTILRFCKNDLWYTHDLVRLLFKFIHHRLSLFTTTLV